MTQLYDTSGAAVSVWDTKGRQIWGGDTPLPPDPPLLDTVRAVTADVWRTGRVAQNTIPDEASTYLSVHRIHAEATGLRLTYGGQLPDGVEMGCAAAIEVPGAGRRAVSWDGASRTVLTGKITQTSDPVDLHVQPGDVLHVYTYYGRRSDGGNHPATPAVWCAHEILPGDQTLTGTARSSGSYPGANGYWAVMPHAITGLAHVDARAWVLLGDSITESGSPALAPAPVGRQDARRTWAQRALDLELPVVNTALWGSTYALDRSAQWATIPDLGQFTDALVAWGYNDLSQAWTLPSRDVGYVQANAITAWTWIGAEGPRVWQATVSPATDSTDGWATLEGQTARADFPYRRAFNEWLRGGAPLIDGAPAEVGDPDALQAGEEGHLLAGVIDQAARVESEPSSGIFRVDHGPLTSDGGHPNSTGHDLMAAALTEAV